MLRGTPAPWGMTMTRAARPLTDFNGTAGPGRDQLAYRGRHAPIETMRDVKDKPIPVIAKPDLSSFTTDSQGGYGRPYRAVDTLGAMLRNGTIEPWHAAAGRRFQEEFHRARLDQLNAMDLTRVKRPGRGPKDELELTESVVLHRNRIDRIIRLLGGNTSLAAFVCWGVLGEGWNVKELCDRSVGGRARKLQPQTATGILIADLCILSVHYGYA